MKKNSCRHNFRDDLVDICLIISYNSYWKLDVHNRNYKNWNKFSCNYHFIFMWIIYHIIGAKTILTYFFYTCATWYYKQSHWHWICNDISFCFHFSDIFYPPLWPLVVDVTQGGIVMKKCAVVVQNCCAPLILRLELWFC